MRRQLSIFDTNADLESDGAPDGCMAQVMGALVAGDGGGAFYKYDALNTAPVSATVKRPTDFVVGAWVKQTNLSASVLYYSSTGLITPPTKAWVDTVSPSTGNGYVVDISSAGFSSILTVKVMAIKPTSVANSCPNVSLDETPTATELKLNIVEGNPATLVLLGITLLSGAPLAFANVTGLTLSIEVTGN